MQSIATQIPFMSYVRRPIPFKTLLVPITQRRLRNGVSIHAKYYAKHIKACACARRPLSNASNRDVLHARIMRIQ